MSCVVCRQTLYVACRILSSANIAIFYIPFNFFWKFDYFAGIYWYMY